MVLTMVVAIRSMDSISEMDLEEEEPALPRKLNRSSSLDLSGVVRAPLTDAGAQSSRERTLKVIVRQEQRSRSSSSLGLGPSRVEPATVTNPTRGRTRHTIDGPRDQMYHPGAAFTPKKSNKNVEKQRMSFQSHLVDQLIAIHTGSLIHKKRRRWVILDSQNLYLFRGRDVRRPPKSSSHELTLRRCRTLRPRRSLICTALL